MTASKTPRITSIANLSRVAEVVTLSVMAGLTIATAAMAYSPEAEQPAETIHHLPTVIVTASGAQEVTQLEPVIVTAKRQAQ